MNEENAAELQTSVNLANVAPQLIALDELHESPLNPRKFIDEAKIIELAASMREHGFHSWVPIVGRTRPTGTGYEVAAGHRRRIAAIRAGLTHVPAIVVEMSDAEFLRILNFDNSGREEVHPLHEGAGWRDYMALTGETVATIAARLGKGTSYVYQRIQYASLVPEAQQAFLSRPKFAGHASLIARLSPTEQLRALKACEPPAWDPEKGLSVRELAAWIKKNLHLDLSEAPFPLASETLDAVAGSCQACPQRVENFKDFDPTQDLPNVCTNPRCYHGKIEAQIAAETLRLAEVQGADKAYRLSQQHYTDLEGVIPKRDWRRILGVLADPEKCKQGVIVEGEDRGVTVYCEVQIPIAEEPPILTLTPAPAPKKVTPSKEDKESARKEKEAQAERDRIRHEEQLEEAASYEREQQERKRREENELAVRKRAITQILAKVGSTPSREVLIDLLQDRLYDLPEQCNSILEGMGLGDVATETAFKVTEILEKASEEKLSKLATLAFMAGDLDKYNLHHGPGEDIISLAKRYKVDMLKIRAEIEGGTRAEPDGEGRPAPKKKAVAPPAKAKPAPAVKTPKPAPAAKKKGAPKKQGLMTTVKKAVAKSAPKKGGKK